MITSAQNPKIKWVRALQSGSRERRMEGLFVVEGVRLAEEALLAGWEARLVLYSEELNERGLRVVEGFASSGALVEAASASALQAASDTETPQGLLLVVAQQVLPLPQPPDFLLIPDGVRDPGNLGTMLRTAAAAGVQAVLCPPETVDAFAPKVVRAGMGAHFRLAIHTLDWDEIAKAVEPVRVYLSEVKDGIPHYLADFRAPLAMVVGGEAEGAGIEAHRLAAASVTIPMPGKSESLNAAVAAGILLFEVVRQRSRG